LTVASTLSSLQGVSRRYAWTVFALIVALMLSDYMTRSVINSVLPDLKREWALSDGQLGLLVSIVPLIVGIAAWPVALLADRWGYVKSITAMATIWCVATALCGLAQNHSQMLMARAAVGLGEAGYGAVGAAVLSTVFPAARMSAILGAFQAAAVFGTVLGVVAGGVIGARHGWQAPFLWAGGASLLLVVVFALFVRETPRSTVGAAMSPHVSLRVAVREVLATRSARFTYVAGGLQVLVLAVIGAWMPTFLAREYGLAADQAGPRAGLLILMAAAGMIAGGALADRAGRARGRTKLHFAGVYALASFVVLSTAFALPAGPLQMALLFVGTLFAGGYAGVAVSAVVDVTHPGLRATAIATVALFNNLLGLAPGPYLVGVLSDSIGLKAALTIVPVAGLFASACFVLAAGSYERDVAAQEARRDT
jgi:MFS family permease